MARRSILSPVRDNQAVKPEVAVALPEETPLKSASNVKPSRRAKLHIGGYYDPNDPGIIAFQKLGIDLRHSQQEMLLEALRDFVAKHEASRAFQ
jgi:hypothetical protein